MANAEHLTVLKQGVAAWNQWRSESENRDVVPDFTNADLSGMDLRAS